MFEEYYKLYKKCDKIKKPTYKKLKKIQEEWNKLTLNLFENINANEMTEMFTRLNEDLIDEDYWGNFVSTLNYASDRMCLNRWCRLQLLLSNAVDKAYADGGYKG